MKPRIEKTSFGYITINGETYEHDIIIRLNGEVKKRKKKLSKKYYDTSHIISIEEAEHIYENENNIECNATSSTFIRRCPAIGGQV